MLRNGSFQACAPLSMEAINDTSSSNDASLHLDGIVPSRISGPPRIQHREVPLVGGLADEFVHRGLDAEGLA